MMTLFALANIPFGTDLLQDVVVHESNAYAFGPPKFVARFVEEAAFTGSRLVFRTKAPPEMLEDKTGATGLHVWNGTLQTLRAARDGTTMDLEPLGQKGEAIMGLVLQAKPPHEPNSLEIFRINESKVSNWQMPAAFGSGGHASYEFDFFQVNWFVKYPVEYNGFEHTRQAVIGLTGEPIVLPEGLMIQGVIDGEYVAWSRRGHYGIHRNGQWHDVTQEEANKVMWRAFEERKRRQKALEVPPPPMPYGFTITTVSNSKAVLASSRKELWIVTTDQFGPNRILASAKADWHQATPTRLAYIEDGNLFVREIVKTSRTEFEALASKAEEKATLKGLPLIANSLAGGVVMVSTSGIAALQGYKANAQVAGLSRDAFAALDPRAEIGRFEGRYGARVVRKNGTSEWIPRAKS